jgi:hypothetical protein
VEAQLRENLQALNKVALARRAFRETFDGAGDKDEESPSKIIIEEMMLMTSSALPYFKERIVQEAQELHDRLVQYETQRVSEMKL